MQEDDLAYNKPAPESEMKSERTAGTTQQPIRRKSKAAEIRRKLEERRKAQAENKEINP
jgi:hypothetical protein